MSGPYDHGMNMPSSNMIDPTYPVYNGNFNSVYPRLAGPATHFDGVAFWYNPNNTEQLYDRDQNMYTGRGGAQQCDETRPICDRCRKGNRECEFPQPTSSSKHSKHDKLRSPKDHATKQEQKDEPTSGLPTIKDESEEDDDMPTSPEENATPARKRIDSTLPARQKRIPKAMAETPPNIRDPISPQSTDMSDTQSRDDTPASSLRTTTNSAEMQARQAKIRSLKPDLQRYLQFQQEYMTYYHYFFKLDPTDFVHNELIDLALTYEPLLYAVVGFSAYHYELQQPNPKLSHFLSYHSKSLSMLRKSLEKNSKVTEATLLAVLQLAIFEEYIGDWVNLVGHHRAAFTMVLELFDHDSIQETDLGRRIFSWYARLDVMVGLMAGSETRLDRQWYAANSLWYQQQIDDDPESDVDIENTVAYFVSANRLLGMDMAALFAKFQKQEIGIADFQAENAAIIERRDNMKRHIQAFNDDYYRIKEFPVEAIRPLNEDDIVNPYMPGGLFKDALWPLNFMWLDWYGIELMQTYQTALLLQQPIPPVLEQVSLEICRIYDAIERWPEAPNGSILGAHASLGIGIVFLQKDAKHIMWARRKLAAIERAGYVFPPAFRKKMAEMWGLTRSLAGDNSIEDWWLPNNEGNVRMLTEIRRVVTERQAMDNTSESEALASVRDLKTLFAKMDIRSQSADTGSGSENFSPTSDSESVERGSNISLSPSSVSFGGSADGRASTASSTPKGSTAGDRHKRKPKRGNSLSGAP